MHKHSVPSDLGVRKCILQYGFDREGLMPWGVFVQALCAAPARLLGHEMILDKAETGKNGLVDEVDVAACVGDAKIIYPKVADC